MTITDDWIAEERDHKERMDDADWADDHPDDDYLTRAELDLP